MVWAGLVFLFFSASGSKLIPYILPVFPPLALLIGRYFADAWESREFPGMLPGYRILLAAALMMAFAFLALPSFMPAQKVAPLGLYRYGFALTLAAGAGTAWALARYRRVQLAFIAVTVMSAIFLVALNAVAPRLDTKSIKTLATTLKPLLKPGDEVASYRKYYQDLPVYLERRITVVDWKGEMDFGTQVEDLSGWMIDSATFWKRWRGPVTLYALMEIEEYDLLRNDRSLKLYPIARTQRTILVSNTEVKQ
jgi:4-amino-4-deoxy-L-arabinose transferase-like glycosyltransferase